MKRMHVTLDEDALEQVRQLTGKKSYSDTINHLITEAVRRDRLTKAIDDLYRDPNPWLPGYVEDTGRIRR
jgi:predicted CopG family antitoxin